MHHHDGCMMPLAMDPRCVQDLRHNVGSAGEHKSKHSRLTHVNQSSTTLIYPFYSSEESCHAFKFVHNSRCRPAWQGKNNQSKTPCSGFEARRRRSSGKFLSRSSNSCYTAKQS